jgi:hypothetical protein
VGLRKPRTIITGIIITGIIAVSGPIGIIIALTGRAEVITRSQLVEYHSAAYGSGDQRPQSSSASLTADAFGFFTFTETRLDNPQPGADTFTQGRANVISVDGLRKSSGRQESGELAEPGDHRDCG